MNAFKKTYIFIFAACFIMLACSPTYAQESFKLSDYKNPDYSYRLLDFNFNMNGGSFSNNEKFDDLNNSRSNWGFNANLQPRYIARKNNARYQGYQQAGLGITPAWSQNKIALESPVVQERERKTGSQSFAFFATSSNRFYNQKQQFVEIGLNLNSGLGLQKSTFKSTPASYPFFYKLSYQESDIDISIPLMVGKGRIEEVQDARLALYILEDLEKSGDLTRKPDANEVLELAHFITSIKNERYFDQRLRHISEITAVDSLLNAMGLKGNSGASYFTLLNDNWSHSSGPVRQSGSRLSFGIVPTVRFFSGNDLQYYNDSVANQTQLTDYKNEHSRIRSNSGLEFMTRYSLEKPINLHWQNSTSFSAGYGINNEHERRKYIENEIVVSDEKFDDIFQRLFVSASNTVGYYPNSRTSILLTANVHYQRNFFDKPEDANETYEYSPSYVGAGILVFANYYVSPRLRFNVEMSSNASFRTVETKISGASPEQKIQANNIGTYLNAGFVYSIF
ncbi:MAG: hypothetical protein KG029_08820 [Bacteroidetes bacterium]|nr:hypothetical protein [Bacteroidota bacterium]